jgi:RimJ/RimL family protein N-acetyltransferase
MAKIVPEKFKLKDGREVLIRSPEPSDWEKVRDFLEHIKVESQNTFQFPGQPVLTQEKAKDRIEKATASKKSMIINFELEGRFVAQADFFPFHVIEDHPWLKHNVLFGMTVVKEFWGQGLGKKLLELIEREAKKMGYKYLRAEVREHNERGIKLYTNFGLEITGRKKNFAFIDGKYHDDLFISKEIL